MIRRSVMLATLLGTTLLQAAELQKVKLGPFIASMTIDEAKAAGPQLEWRDTKLSKRTGKALAIAAPNAVRLGGLSHDIQIEPGYYGQYDMHAEHVVHVNDAMTCQQVTLPVAAELEVHFGSFKAEPGYVTTAGTGNTLRWETRRSSNGVIAVPVPTGASGPIRSQARHDLVKIGKRSAMLFEPRYQRGKEGLDRRDGYAEYKRDNVRVRIDSKYARAMDTSAPNCMISITVEVQGQLPAARTVELGNDDVNGSIGVGLRHHSLDDVTLTASPVAVELTCRLDAAETVFICTPSSVDAVRPELVAAAQRRIGALDSAALLDDADNPVPLEAKTTIVLAQSDRVPLDFVSTLRTPITEFAWRRVPPKELMQQYDRLAAGRIPVTCHVQLDQSLVCVALNASKALVTAAAATEAQRAAVEIIRHYLPTPLLKSGKSSAGAVFETVVEFGGEK